MKFLKYFLLIILYLTFNSCQKTSLEKVDDFKNKKIGKFIVDGFPITGKMLDSSKSSNQGHFNFDGLIFSNKVNDKTIMIALYTDQYRYLEIEFINNFIPKEIIDRIELNDKVGELLTINEKQNIWGKLIVPTNIIENKYFVTNKGFIINDPKNKILNLYGKPDNYRKKDGLEIYEWSFLGDLLIDQKTDVKNKKVAKDSYGNRTTLYFKNDHLVAMVFNNEIP